MRLIKNSLRAERTAHCVEERRENLDAAVRATDATTGHIPATWWCLQLDLLPHIFNPWRTAFPLSLVCSVTSLMLLAHTRGILPFVFPVTVGHISIFQSYPYLPSSYVFKLTISRLNWHIRNLRARQLRASVIYVESFQTTGHFFPRTRTHYLNDCFPNFSFSRQVYVTGVLPDAKKKKDPKGLLYYIPDNPNDIV